jgi:hypothetical protein
MSFQQEKPMTQDARVRQAVSTVVAFSTQAETRIKQGFMLTPLLFVTFTCFAQQPATPTPEPNQPEQSQTPATGEKAMISIPAGSKLSLVLTHSVLSRAIHRGDDIYAQTVFPIALANAVIIPPGTFVQGKVDKLERNGSRGELHLQSMSMIFPDGYVAPIPGPLHAESDEGYVELDPSKGNVAAAILAPIGGGVAGALIGHAANKSPGMTLNGLTINPSKLKSTAIGSIVGLAAGGIVSLVILTRSHQFFLDVGTPVEMTLQQPMLLETDQVAEAVRRSSENPVSPQPVAPRPQPCVNRRCD